MSGHAVIVLFFLLGWIIGLVWVWADATVNSSQSAFLWALVVFFGGLLGVLLYVLLGRDDKGEDDRHRGNRRRSPSDQSGRNRSGSNRQPSPNASHVCQTCGEEYFADSSIDISSCRSCGGIHVEPT